MPIDMASNKVEVSASEVMKCMTVTIHLRDIHWLRFRLKVATALFRLGCFVVGMKPIIIHPTEQV